MGISANCHVTQVKQLSSKHLCPSTEIDARWLLVQRIIANPLLAKSVRLVSLLQYVTRMTLEGRTAELTETHIGVKVFDRPEGYNSSDDNIVSFHARLLRAKLQTYFERAGESEELILTIPKGGYVLIFEKRSIEPVLSPLAAANLEIMPAAKPPRAPRKWNSGFCT